MTKHSSNLAYTIAIVTGGVLWALTAALGGRAEPWDAPGYWTISYPLAIVLAGTLGYTFPLRPWRWALALMFTQLAVMLFGGSGLDLLPLGLILMGILSLPAVALASIAARISSHKTH